MPAAVALWGRNHTELGDVAVRSPVPGLALALTRGALPKAYGYVDPNEDVVAASAGDRATLMVVADGHGGIESSEAVVAVVGRALGHDPPPADLAEERLVDVFYDGALEVLERNLDRPEAPESNTTMALVLATPERVQWASFGDSAVLAGGAEGAVRLDDPRHLFLGYPASEADIARHLSHGVLERHSDAWVVLATDGLGDYARGGPELALASAATEHEVDSERLAMSLVRAAFAGGAGDNVGLACLAPPS
jgi:serine/threonine protein phosphatase PrpC